MPDHTLRTTLTLAIPREKVFDFFSDAANLARITPPELDFRIITPLPIAMGVGTLIDYRIGLHGIPMRWRTRISKWVPNEEFEDEQLRGPYALWVHRHSFRDNGQGSTVIEDEVRYRLPFGVLGALAHPIVKMQLRRIFAHRSSTVRRLLGDTSVPTADETPRFG